MVIVTGKHLQKIIANYPDAATELSGWAKMVRTARWQSIADIQAMFGDADRVRGYVVFNMRHNRYRLITVVHFARTKNGKTTQGHVYIRSFLTHKQYDNIANWDKEFGS